MTRSLHRLLVSAVVWPALLAASCPAEPGGGTGCTDQKACCGREAKSAGTAEAKAERHPLKGVIVDILPDRSALLVKHEAIPGYMSAMTMLFRVDAATLSAAVKGARITAVLVKRDGEFWLEEIRPQQP